MPLRLSPTQAAFNARGDGSFNVPFDRQVQFLRDKLNLPTAHFDDILKSAHDRAFVVAGATKADLLTDFHDAVTKAAKDGKSIQWFRKNFDEIVRKNGWEGWTGSDTKAGRDWRARIIYQTNLTTSYAAGRWAQLNDPDLIKLRPYWKYIHNDSVQHPRPLHVRWSGLVLKHDDPWWKTHFPPNGWGCRCRVTAVSARQFDGDTPPDDGTRTVEDRFGQSHRVPNGIDYGWDYAPGRSWTPEVEKYPYQLARDVVKSWGMDGVFRRWEEQLSKQLQDLRRQPRFSSLDGDALIEALRLADVMPKEKLAMAIIAPDVRTLLQTDRSAVYVSADTLIKQMIKREGQPIDVSHYETLQDLMNQAEVITQQDSNRVLYWTIAGRVWKAVLKTTSRRDEIYLLSLHPANAKDIRRQVPPADWDRLGVA